jgi:hypothetical protein
MRTQHLIAGALTAAVVATLTACDNEPAGPDDDLLTRVAAETIKFAATAQALAAGYEEDQHCVQHPDLGSMGAHWVNGPLMDGEFDAMKPEVLLYEPQPNGGVQLVGVEYIVIAEPDTDLEGAARPDFDGHPFDVGGVGPLMAQGVPHWSLHVWVHRANPAGVFAPFNPDVTCP